MIKPMVEKIYIYHGKGVVGAPKSALRVFFGQGSNSYSFKIIANLLLDVPN